jgi:hypothetical protein
MEQNSLTTRTVSAISSGRGRNSLQIERNRISESRTALSAQMDSDNEVQAVEAEVFDPLGLANGLSPSGGKSRHLSTCFSNHVR